MRGGQGVRRGDSQGCGVAGEDEGRRAGPSPTATSESAPTTSSSAADFAEANSLPYETSHPSLYSRVSHWFASSKFVIRMASPS